MRSYFKTEIWHTNGQKKNHVPSRAKSSSLRTRHYLPPSFKAIILLATTINVTSILDANAADSQWQQQYGFAGDYNKLYTSLPNVLGYKQHVSHEISSHSAQDSRHNIGLGSIYEPTPPLTNSFSRSRSHSNADVYPDSSAYVQSHTQLIWPQPVMRAPRSLAQAAPDPNLMSPIFELRSIENTQQQAPAEKDVSQFNSQSDANNLDLVEQGSGSGWPDGIPFSGGDEITTLVDPSMMTRTGPLGTAIFEQMPNHPGGDSPPVLMRRLPKLIATSGSPWQYAIPSDTFQDEDGDLRQLKSSLVLRQPSDKLNTIDDSSQRGAFAKHLHWLQYDQNTQTLYGFPIDDDVGRHEYILQVHDRSNNLSNETVEIIVRRHQSSQAFTHAITMGVELTTQRRSSMPEILTDLAKFISEGVFTDPNSNSLVIHAYKINDSAKDSSTIQQLRSPLSVTWSNSSLPIHPCDLSSIESIFRLLVDSRYITPTWSLLQTHSSSELAPSQGLIKALSPDFKPSSVSINLQGSCESRKSHSENAIRGPNPLDTEPRVKNRLGKMRWKLGQPIIYHIPNDVFIYGDESKITNNLSLTLHTIDGKTLDQDLGYDFLEFDQDKQMIFGLPYDYIRHVGQKELLLTARDPETSQMARETFVIDIEPQDLTTINNRAFRMSLYFMIRANAFGPREKVQISRRMIAALQLGELNYQHDQDRPDFTVIGIQQFTTSSNLESSTALSDPGNAWKYQDKIHLVNEASLANGGDHANSEGSTFYKFTWTNETIGYRGECPVEVIKENILYALERSMIDYVPSTSDQKLDDNSKNDSVRFYERLRSYFEPELDLIHLRFEPLGACIDALELHDVGNSDVADSADRAGDLEQTTEPPAPTPHIRSTEVIPKTKEISPVNSDEYWAIVVLIILVVAIIFVVMMLFMGLHTYRINQEKRFELQLKLAQARQNSMYLSSMMLADQSYAGDLLTRQAAAMASKPAYVDERSSRKPVILDTEKRLLTNGHPQVPMYKPTSVHLTGDSVQTMPLRQNTTFTMDSLTNMQNLNNNIPNGDFNNMTAAANQQQMFADGRQQSMTLNRRTVGAQARPIGRQASMSQLSQSQSILTVASTGPQGHYVPHSQVAMPFVYAPMPVFYESSAEMPREL